MRSRHLLLAALVIAVAAPRAADAAPRHAKAKATKPAKVAKKRAVTRRRARAHATASRRTGTRRGGLSMALNMPPGWRWPPSPAMIAAGKSCTDRLDELGVEWKPAPALEKVATPITVPAMTFGGIRIVSWFRRPPFVMDCHLALALATFAKDLHDLGIRQMKFSRIYGYTPVRVGGKTKPILSRHALGLAMDVWSVTDADGHESVVATDYKAGDPMLLRLETFLNDSGGFRTVLTPANDPISHRDHFHIEAKVDYGP
ncbi:MAG TPA: extensin family protein [Kofleriaceae bacterium]|nr:extensin family protein [Kofleriaceae bacterium]